MSEDTTYPEYTPMREMPITASIPYLFRWKILNAKLLIADLETLAIKHKIAGAQDLILTVAIETNEMCKRINMDILERRKERKKYAE